MVCAKLTPAVSGLEEEFAGRVVTRNITYETDEAKEIVKELGFKSHGLIVRNESGELLFKQADHDVKIEQVRDKLKQLIGA
jgi:hypothetical protein